MVKVAGRSKNTRGKFYDYPEDAQENIKINKKIKEDISKFCKERKIVKGKLVENFYKSILVKFRDGSLNATNGYITMNIF